MSLGSIGDMRQHFLNMRSNTQIKTDLGRLVQELTTGNVSDLTAHLGAGQTGLSSIDRQLEMIKSFQEANTQTGQLLTAMQGALGGIDTRRESVSSALLLVNDGSTTSQMNEVGTVAKQGFEDVVQTLNMRFADRAVFSGNDVSTSPMASAESILDELKTALIGVTTAGDAKIAIETWFNDVGGGFETLGYLGDDQGYATRPTDVDQEVEIGLRADDPAMRELLTSFAMGALATDPAVTMNTEERRSLLQQSGVDLLSGASSLAGVQSRLGFAESQVENATVRLAAQDTSLGISRNTLVLADPFETATRLEQVQLQLETHYTLTARLSRLSLTEYLR